MAVIRISGEVANVIKQESRDIERKIVSILKVLKDSPGPMGSRLIAHRLRDYGVNLTERAIRYHLKKMDESGLTQFVSRRRGRLVTKSGINELDYALVGDRVGAAMTNIEILICKTSFELDKLSGDVPVNISLFPADRFDKALRIMKAVCNINLCASNLVAIASHGEKLGDIQIPEGKVGLATLSNILISAILLKAGIPMDFKFAGVLQIRNHECLRFVDLIEYTGSSLNPYEIFISSKMTSVSGIPRDGNGKILATLCELPSSALTKIEAVNKKMYKMGIHNVAKIGRINEPLCETSVGLGKLGMILTDGLNLVAAAAEAGIKVENHAVSGTFNFARMKDLSGI
jgi:repressor of nif and glnA expression